jgi:hypothetical protein
MAQVIRRLIEKECAKHASVSELFDFLSGAAAGVELLDEPSINLEATVAKVCEYKKKDKQARKYTEYEIRMLLGHADKGRNGEITLERFAALFTDHTATEDETSRGSALVVGSSGKSRTRGSTLTRPTQEKDAIFTHLSNLRADNDKNSSEPAQIQRHTVGVHLGVDTKRQYTLGDLAASASFTATVTIDHGVIRLLHLGKTQLQIQDKKKSGERRQQEMADFRQSLSELEVQARRLFKNGKAMKMTMEDGLAMTPFEFLEQMMASAAIDGGTTAVESEGRGGNLLEDGDGGDEEEDCKEEEDQDGDGSGGDGDGGRISNTSKEAKIDSTNTKPIQYHFSPRGVLLSEGSYYFETSVHAGSAAMGWVDGRYGIKLEVAAEGAPQWLLDTATFKMVPVQRNPSAGFALPSDEGPLFDADAMAVLRELNGKPIVVGCCCSTDDASTGDGKAKGKVQYMVSTIADPPFMPVDRKSTYIDSTDGCEVEFCEFEGQTVTLHLRGDRRSRGGRGQKELAQACIFVAPASPGTAWRRPQRDWAKVRAEDVSEDDGFKLLPEHKYSSKLRFTLGKTLGSYGTRECYFQLAADATLISLFPFGKLQFRVNEATIVCSRLVEGLDLVGGFVPMTVLTPTSELQSNFGREPFLLSARARREAKGKVRGRALHKELTASTRSTKRQPAKGVAKGPVKGVPKAGVTDAVDGEARDEECPVLQWAHQRIEETHARQQAARFGEVVSKAGANAVRICSDGELQTMSQCIPTVVYNGPLLTTSCWYYEVTLLEEGMLHRTKVGWTDPEGATDASQNLGVGDDKHSWSYCPQQDDGQIRWKERTGMACHDGKRHGFGEIWRRGTTVGCAVDLEKREMRFSTDGQWGPATLAFKDFEYSGGLMPAATFCGLCGQRIKFNFGKWKFRYSPPYADYKPVEQWVTAYMPTPGEGLKIPIDKFWAPSASFALSDDSSGDGGGGVRAEALQKLLDMGFGEKDAEKALRESPNGLAEEAINLLYGV